ncbi:unnamed protein product [Rhizophagus irregularis]|uniref:Uncharacterized protein n=1 Tax=Rhizophagus irregularis (strain DAOM 181602 / DAOM 197198 / MUCL 43194) TaxID=747089 RepID=A0A2P4PTS2_RHIID|nr:hypothetical protein GLOIN_2v1777965 [Rhizophagus irregularis DAOM 181602=DAOM 197198]POG68750.1 hypothetical protein GLOIN_2v1777965 [Rhizophagus irregularis DAOM 181602=DAOM 197198]CAB4490387.1 unnamed protein product [Rhizophagus irregularis]CAB5217501.1 unnamed protein product [Rhizophagus irregularis]CAG8656360.1 3883_t:CDS:2 [Rhizophagus irregularis]|eukprot:XP_025175616.1 hypothetical protein GLOIN_2v1777965 [Rhizophagus irregularis DAOM 181602=DAOM 197198]
MATTTRSKHKQMEQMAKEAVVEKENLAQDVIEESEDDSDYEAKDKISKQSKQQKASTKIGRPKQAGYGVF